MSLRPPYLVERQGCRSSPPMVRNSIDRHTSSSIEWLVDPGPWKTLASLVGKATCIAWKKCSYANCTVKDGQLPAYCTAELGTVRLAVRIMVKSGEFGTVGVVVNHNNGWQCRRANHMLDSIRPFADLSRSKRWFHTLSSCPRAVLKVA
jgi:hypothetical protein